VELKDEIKKRLGQDVPVGILFNGAEFGIKDGLTSEETQGLAKYSKRLDLITLTFAFMATEIITDCHTPMRFIFLNRLNI